MRYIALYHVGLNIGKLGGRRSEENSEVGYYVIGKFSEFLKVVEFCKNRLYRGKLICEKFLLNLVRYG